MYANSGAKIKSLAFWGCVVGIFADFILAIVIFKWVMTLTSGYYSDGEVGISLIAAVTVFCILCFLTWLAFLLFAAFGELVDNSTELLKQVGNQCCGDTTKDKKMNMEEELKTVCPKCGEKISDDAIFCGVCGQRLNT